MQESEFHRRSEEAMQRIEEALEAAEPQGIECDRMGSTLTVTLPSGRQLVINTHTPSQELWLASPISGGLHFTWQEELGWALKDRRRLGDVLAADLWALMSVKISFPESVEG